MPLQSQVGFHVRGSGLPSKRSELVEMAKRHGLSPQGTIKDLQGRIKEHQELPSLASVACQAAAEEGSPEAEASSSSSWTNARQRLGNIRIAMQRTLAHIDSSMELSSSNLSKQIQAFNFMMNRNIEKQSRDRTGRNNTFKVQDVAPGIGGCRGAADQSCVIEKIKALEGL